MEAQWICDRAALRTLIQQHPDWGTAELAIATGRSTSWGKPMAPPIATSSS
ncbi:MAG TPA: hypothetical protein VKR06_13145 [Ktedonosporobacter sp.]|nr:hypothetical protein [Ktedonosporobacter sp.]